MPSRLGVSVVGLGILLGGAGCASLSERVAKQIEYIMPREQITPGEVLHVDVVIPPEIKSGWGIFNQRNYRLFPRGDLQEKGVYSVFIPVPLGSPPGEYPVRFVFTLKSDEKQIQETLYVHILPDFRLRTQMEAKLPKFKIQSYRADLALIVNAAGKQTFRAKIQQDFNLPLSGKIVTTFGMQRRFNQNDSIDLDGLEIVPVSTGTLEVIAAADGQVQLAQKLPTLGNTVVIDHGFSFATVYCHLKSLEVKTGQIIRRGELLGTVGQTGDAAVGKRLLYRMLVAGIPVDIEKQSRIDIFR